MRVIFIIMVFLGGLKAGDGYYLDQVKALNAYNYYTELRNWIQVQDINCELRQKYSIICDLNRDEILSDYPFIFALDLPGNLRFKVDKTVKDIKILIDPSYFENLYNRFISAYRDSINSNF